MFPVPRAQMLILVKKDYGGGLGLEFGVFSRSIQNMSRPIISMGEMSGFLGSKKRIKPVITQ